MSQTIHVEKTVETDKIGIKISCTNLNFQSIEIQRTNNQNCTIKHRIHEMKQNNSPIQ